MGTGLLITVEIRGERVLLRLVGKVDATSTPTLENKIHEILDDKHHQAVLDFSQVDYLTSAGMRLLLSATKKFKAMHGGVTFCGMHGEVLDVIKMAGFDRILPIYGSEQEALEALAG